MFPARIKHLCAFWTLHQCLLSVSVDGGQGAVSGSSLVSCTLGEASAWLLWVALLPGCSTSMADQPVCLQCWWVGMNSRLLIAVRGFGAVLPPRELGYLKFLKVPSLLG